MQFKGVLFIIVYEAIARVCTFFSLIFGTYYFIRKEEGKESMPPFFYATSFMYIGSVALSRFSGIAMFSGNDLVDLDRVGAALMTVVGAHAGAQLAKSIENRCIRFICGCQGFISMMSFLSLLSLIAFAMYAVAAGNFDFEWAKSGADMFNSMGVDLRGAYCDTLGVSNMKGKGLHRCILNYY